MGEPNSFSMSNTSEVIFFSNIKLSSIIMVLRRYLIVTTERSGFLCNGKFEPKKKLQKFSAFCGVAVIVIVPGSNPGIGMDICTRRGARTEGESLR